MTEETNEKQTAEFNILEPILKAARDRAKQQDRSLPQVAKVILQRASENATPLLDAEGNPTEPAHPAERPPGKKKRLRFGVNAEEHAVVKERIRSAGMSMTAAMEYGLLQYGRTGKY